jgi:FtsP/CotA-like multicopper oxidase with cupredoxin domain
MAMRDCVVVTAALMCASCGERVVSLPDAPIIRSRDGLAAVTLTAARGPDGRDTFVFDGRDVPPTIRVAPGNTLKIRYVNALPVVPETAPRNGQMNMTNLHFHGLSVSPARPQDDVLDMIAMPGETLDYTLAIPRDHPPGLHWYHAHPHGESHRQVLDGMSGALIIEGIEAYAPEVRTLRERVLQIRELDIENNPNAPALRAHVQVEQTACGESHDQVNRLFTVNGVLRPEIAMRPGERQFWRIVNAGADRYVDIEAPNQRFEIVAYDGLPVAYHDPGRSPSQVHHVLLPPAGRVEAIVTAPDRGGRSALRTRCVDTGPDGDPNPGMLLADITSTDTAPAGPPEPGKVATTKPPAFRLVDLERMKREPPRFTAVFSEDDKGFYINGQKYSLDAQPMVRAKIGGYEHWRIVNNSRELHPMHIHQVHFLLVLENDGPFPDPRWLDTVNVSVGGSVDVIMDFTDPIIRGMSLFHCHLLNHEDKGMMAKVLFF